MKALELLIDIRNCLIDYDHNIETKYDEAIAELEEEMLSYKHLIIELEMKIEQLQNRSCESCKHWKHITMSEYASCDKDAYESKYIGSDAKVSCKYYERKEDDTTK